MKGKFCLCAGIASIFKSPTAAFLTGVITPGARITDCRVIFLIPEFCTAYALEAEAVLSSLIIIPAPAGVSISYQDGINASSWQRGSGRSPSTPRP